MKSAIFIFLFCVPAVLKANNFGFGNIPQRDVAVGPSIAHVSFDGGSAMAVNADISWSYDIFSLSVNGKMVRGDDTSLWGVQLEGTIYLIANLGAGMGFLSGDGTTEPCVHLFVGLPLGSSLRSISNTLHEVFQPPFKGGFIEPYYRLNWFNGKVFHEVGVFFKLTTWGF